MGIFDFRHLLRSQQFDRETLEVFFELVDEIKDDYLRAKKAGLSLEFLRQRLAGKLMYSFFYEPSTRTRFSFETAGRILGMDIVSTENAGEFSSVSKGESLEDSILILCGYRPDVIVLRHTEEGAAERAKDVVDKHGFKTSIINAGDGPGQHPTQALLDLYTIGDKIGRFDNFTLVVGGDLRRGRTVRSLVYLATKFDGVRVIFVSPPELSVKQDIKDHLNEHGVPFAETTEMEEPLKEADVVYWTRTQTERSGDLIPGNMSDIMKKKYTIGPHELELLRKNAIIMHPLPNVGEISQNVYGDKRAVFFEQAENGLYVRMALLCELLEKRR